MSKLRLLELKHIFSGAVPASFSSNGPDQLFDTINVAMGGLQRSEEKLLYFDIDNYM